MKSSLHKNKQLVTIGEFVTMVQDQNWKKDVSYLLIEESDEESEKGWREGWLIPVSEIPFDTLQWYSEEGLLQFENDEIRVDIRGVEGTVMQELVDAVEPAFRYTVYMT